MSNGKFIVFEGLDGAGTTTQSGLLQKKLCEMKISSTLTCEPTKGEIGKLIRRFLSKEIIFDETTMALLFAADRCEHVNNFIIPQKNKGEIVISDRYVISTFAYQSLGVDYNFIRKVNDFIISPDLTFYIRISPENALSRKNSESPDYYERLDFQKKVHENYEKFAEEYKINHKIITISGDLSIESIHDKVIEEVLKIIY